MNIAFLTPEYPHAKIAHAAGLGTSIKNLVQALSKKDVNVTVFVYGQKKEEFFEEEGVHFYLIKDKKYMFAKWFFYRKHIQNYCNQVILKNNIQLIEAPDWTGITAFMKFKVPLIIRFHGSDSYFCHIENRKQKLKNYWFEKLAVKNAQAYVAPTKYAGEVSAKIFGLNKNKVITIHYGLDLLKFTNHNPDQYEKGLILYIGTIIRKKGVLELPKIFNIVRNHIPNAKLLLIGADSADIQTGEKSTWKLLESEFNSEDLKEVNYLGKIPYAQVQEYIKKANVCVFPTYAETLGMVTIESMALQKPVVNSSIGWAQELMEDEESGFLVYPSNHELYAKRIIELIEDSEKVNQMGKKAQEKVEKSFDINKIVQKNIEFYFKQISK